MGVLVVVRGKTGKKNIGGSSFPKFKMSIFGQKERKFRPLTPVKRKAKQACVFLQLQA